MKREALKKEDYSKNTIENDIRSTSAASAEKAPAEDLKSKEAFCRQAAELLKDKRPLRTYPPLKHIRNQDAELASCLAGYTSFIRRKEMLAELDKCLKERETEADEADFDWGEDA